MDPTTPEYTAKFHEESSFPSPEQHEAEHQQLAFRSREILAFGPPTYKNSFQNWVQVWQISALIPGFLTLSWHFSEVDQKECTRHPFCFVRQLTGFKNPWEGSVWAHAPLWVPRVAQEERTVLLWSVFLFATTFRSLGLRSKVARPELLGLLVSHWKPKISLCSWRRANPDSIFSSIRSSMEGGRWVDVWLLRSFHSAVFCEQLAWVFLWGTFATSFSARNSTWWGNIWLLGPNIDDRVCFLPYMILRNARDSCPFNQIQLFLAIPTSKKGLEFSRNYNWFPDTPPHTYITG